MERVILVPKEEFSVEGVTFSKGKFYEFSFITRDNVFQIVISGKKKNVIIPYREIEEKVDLLEV